jgi:hypothetical protein
MHNANVKSVLWCYKIGTPIYIVKHRHVTMAAWQA